MPWKKLALGACSGCRGIHHSVARISGDFTEGVVLTQVHHCRGIGNTAVVAVSEGGDVALAHVLDHLQQVGLDVELGGLTGGIGCNGGAGAGLAEGEVVTALGVRSLAVGISFEQFVGKHPIAPTTVVVEQSQRTDGLVENVQVSGVQQQTLSGQQGFTSHLEGGGSSGVRRICRTGVLLKVHKNLVFNDIAARRSTKSLISGTLSRILSTRITPEKR